MQLLSDRWKCMHTTRAQCFDLAEVPVMLQQRHLLPFGYLYLCQELISFSAIVKQQLPIPAWIYKEPLENIPDFCQFSSMLLKRRQKTQELTASAIHQVPSCQPNIVAINSHWTCLGQYEAFVRQKNCRRFDCLLQLLYHLLQEEPLNQHGDEEALIKLEKVAKQIPHKCLADAVEQLED